MRIDQSDITLPDEDQTPTIVIFRRWGKMNGGGVIALFPTLPSDDRGLFCESYEHVGQHGGANYYKVIDATKPASLEESDTQALKEELEGIGYVLKVHRRWQPSREPREKVPPVPA